MSTINTIEDLARILREQPTGTEKLRAIFLAQELLDLQERSNHLAEEPQKFNAARQETNQLTNQRLNAVEGQLSNPEGGYQEHTTRTGPQHFRISSRASYGPYVAPNQDGPIDLQLNGTVAQAVQEGRVRHSGRLFRPPPRPPSPAGQRPPTRLRKSEPPQRFNPGPAPSPRPSRQSCALPVADILCFPESPKGCIL